MFCVFFFFQAEDGIRDVAVTGVQTCALPISHGGRRGHLRLAGARRLPRAVPRLEGAGPSATRTRSNDMKAMLIAMLLAAAPAARTIDLAVTDKGFEPSKIDVKKGEPLHVVVTRKTDATCAKELVIQDQGIRKELPLDKPVAIDFTPQKSGEIRYACGMGMIGGVLLVQ